MNPLSLVLGSYRAEWLKLSRRPAIWIIGGLLWLGTLALGYLFWFAFIRLLSSDPTAGPITPADFGLLPNGLLGQVLPLLSALGGPLCLILGALTIGREFGWGTLKTILTQRPGRLALVTGKLLALVPLLFIFSTIALLIGLVTSLITAIVVGTSGSPPEALILIKSLGVGWLILAVWTSLGVALTALFRSTAAAIGVGLIYALVVETAIGGIAGVLNQLQWLNRATPGSNISALINAVRGGATSSAAVINGGQATFVLIIYIAIFSIIAALLIRQRDVI